MSPVLLHGDEEATLRHLNHLRTNRLDRNPSGESEPVAARAQRGRLGRRRITIPPPGPEQHHSIDPAADARIRAHLTEQPDAVDRYTRRGRRVALISDASALPEHTDPAAVLAGLESAAAFLHHHSSLEITPLPIDTRHSNLADAVAALSPGFTAVCLHHTRAEHVDTVRRRLDGLQRRLPVLGTGDDGAAVTMVAALINALRQADATLADARVLIIDAHTAPEIGTLLTAAGVRDLTFAGSRTAAAVLDDTPVPYDALVDLSAGDADAPNWRHDLVPPRITLTFNAGPYTPEPGAITATGRPAPHQVHPLLALPGLLSTAIHRRTTIEVSNRFAAAHALARLAPPGQLLPDDLDTRIAATVYAAAATPVRPRRRQ